MRMANASSVARSARSTSTRPTNLSLNAGLVDEARQLGVNISLAAGAGLEAAVKQARTERWLEENRAALESYNDWVNANGLPLEKYRLF